MKNTEDKKICFLNKNSKELNVFLSIIDLFDMTCEREKYLEGFIEIICKNFEWPLGHIFFIESEAIKPSSLWYNSLGDAANSFISISNKTQFDFDQGLPGRCLLERKSIWVNDLTIDAGSPRTQAIADLSLQSALAIPIHEGSTIYAIAEFFLKDSLEKDEHLLSIADGAAKQVGLLIQRSSSEYEIKIKNQQLSDTVDELQAAQLTALQSEKMASIGQLAAGVAHEINNPIGFIKGNIDVISDYVDSFKESLSLLNGIITSKEKAPIIKKAKDYLEKEDVDFLLEDTDSILTSTKKGLTRVVDIVNNLKTFSRVDSASDFEDVDINECIESTLQIIMNEIKYHCEVKKSLSSLPIIKAHAGQLNQVFLNLLVNAGQAIESNGLITIETKKKDNTIEIQISDNGKGIPLDEQANIFNPFFTTKPVGEGTGLGLSISYGIIERHNGNISVESEVGKGTTFTVSLPIIEKLPEE